MVSSVPCHRTGTDPEHIEVKASGKASDSIVQLVFFFISTVAGSGLLAFC